MRPVFACVLLLPLLVANPSHAQQGPQDGPIGFQTPSKNIACQFYHYDGPVLRCDIGKVDARPRRPGNCELKWGHAFEMSMNGRAGRVCAGDTVADARLPVLAYGRTAWQRDGFICRSDHGGLTCLNAAQHGFSLSRAGQKLF